MMTLPSLLKRSALLHGARTAIYDAEGDLTWSAYVKRIARAAGMLSSLGVRRGERFAILCRNCVRQAELFYAGYWAGSIPVPINYRLAPPEIAAVIEDAQCRLLVIESTFAGLLDHASLDGVLSLALCIDAEWTFAIVDAKCDYLASCRKPIDRIGGPARAQFRRSAR